MDAEEYYDSLDEDSNYGSLDSCEDSCENFLFSAPKNSIPSRIPVRKTVTPLPCKEDDDIVPFYDHSLSKSEVELKKITSVEGKPKSKKRYEKRKTLIPKMNKFKSNSYLDMFYAKLGVGKLDLSNRATCASLSPKSFATCEDFEGASWMDLTEMESIYTSKNAEIPDLSLSLTSLDSKLCSVSQLNVKVTSKESKNRLRKGYSRRSVVNVPELGRLGPEIPMEKLELLKKRQEYGHKVSQKNKIKMMEKQLLLNLQQEINECKNVS